MIFLWITHYTEKNKTLYLPQRACNLAAKTGPCTANSLKDEQAEKTGNRTWGERKEHEQTSVRHTNAWHPWSYRLTAGMCEGSMVAEGEAGREGRGCRLLRALSMFYNFVDKKETLDNSEHKW